MYVFQEFPKWKYHEDGRSCVVQSLDGELGLGAGWGDSPTGPFAEAASVQETAETLRRLVLDDLAAHPGSTAKEVAKRRDLSEGVTKELCEHLRAEGLVERGPFGRYHLMPDGTPQE